MEEPVHDARFVGGTALLWSFAISPVNVIASQRFSADALTDYVY